MRARANTAFAFFSLSPNHLFSIVEASMARNVAPPDDRDVDKYDDGGTDDDDNQYDDGGTDDDDDDECI